ncbi:Hypothetical protein PBC10988_32140 [Planctomycetales bacterium 10988]|nr:Hypothetical protein PBC10988_32140 [Planctomycetales bacterium 10988]
MNSSVLITFDCLPLRAISRRDLPMDASPAFQALCARSLQALDQHGAHNTYFVYNAKCTFYLTNDPSLGMMEFSFEGTMFTDSTDRKTTGSALSIELLGEHCDWLTQPVVEWFHLTVKRAVEVEFDRYINAGDLEKTKARIEKLQQETDEKGGFVGMYL